MKKIITLQTNDSEKLVQIESMYTVQGYFTFSLLVHSGAFRGEASFCVSHIQLQTFAEEIGGLNERLEGRAILRDSDSDAFIALEGMGCGRIAVAGQVGGTHQDQFLKFRFETDQTILPLFQKQLYEILAGPDDHACADVSG